MKPLSRIVIVGGGTSGWLAGAMLSHHLKRELCAIELIESEEIGTIGVGESTVPPFVSLLHRLGIDESEFVRATDATYKLGIQFVGWQHRAKSYFHPFGVIGQPIGGHDFYQCWLRARAQGDTSSLMDFSPCSVTRMRSSTNGATCITSLPPANVRIASNLGAARRQLLGAEMNGHDANVRGR